MQSYETSDISWERMGTAFQKDPAVEKELLRYARFVSRRGLVSNTFGNLAVRVRNDILPEQGVVYTKCRGVSLEEMSRQHIIVTDVEHNKLIFGSIPPSNGHQMNRAILACRPDVNAVIHTHPDWVIAFFSQIDMPIFRFVSIDSALVLGAPPRILPQKINLEADTGGILEFVAGTNCLVMPNHGLTTVGSSLSEAYHRHTAFLAEVRRIALAMWIRRGSIDDVAFVDDDETQQLYMLGGRIIYGRTSGERTE